MKIFRRLLKTALIKRWFRAGLAGLILAAGAGAGYVGETSAATNSVIPASFFGMHSISVIPGQPYGLYRTWDDCYAAGGYEGNKWWSIEEPSRGTFDWRAMDDLVNALPPGVDILYCFGETPSWAAATWTAPPTNIRIGMTSLPHL